MRVQDITDAARRQIFICLVSMSLRTRARSAECNASQHIKPSIVKFPVVKFPENWARRAGTRV